MDWREARHGLIEVLMLLVLVALGILIATAAVFPAAEKAPSSAVKVIVGAGHGSGVHLGNGYFLTAEHVIGDAKAATLKPETGDSLNATVLWTQKDYDVALLRVTDYVPLAAASLSCKDPQIGDSIATIGNPGGLEHIRTWGRVASSVAARSPFTAAYIMDGTVAHGMSGGPVFNQEGKVAGIIAAMASQTDGFFSQTLPLTYVVPGSAICQLLARS